MIELLKAVSDESRLRLLNILIHEELCVCEIETILNMSQSNTSRHLNKLKQVKIIESYKEAQWVHYRISKSFLKDNKLFEYLKENFSQNSLYTSDFDKLKSYKTLNLSCTDIRDNADRVIKLISKEA